MTLETMSTDELQKELFRRTANMESWTNDVNLTKAKDDLKDELEKFTTASAKDSEKKKTFNLLSIVFGLLTFVSLIVLVVTLSFLSNVNLYWVLANYILMFIFGNLYTLFKNKENKCENSTDDHQKRSEILYWYFMLMSETDSKMLYRKVYEDTYAIVNKLCKDPEMKKKIETVKKELGIDFSYVEEKLKAAEERVKEV